MISRSGPAHAAISRRRLLRATAAVPLAAAPLAAGLSGCGLLRTGPDYPREAIQLATGSMQGVYYRYGTEFARVIRRELAVETDVQETAGSLANIQRVGTQPGVFAILAGDAATDAVSGNASFEYDPRPLRALARVYDDYTHLIARSDRPINQLTDLRDRVVSIGTPNSGVALIAGRMLQLIGINVQTDPNIRKLGLGPSMAELAAGRLDAFFWSGGVPTASIQSLMRRTSVQLIDLGGYARSMHRRFSRSYRAATIPSNIYASFRETPTVAVPNYLVTSERTDAGLTYQLTRLLFEFRDELANRLPLAGFLDVRGAIETSNVKLHDGAQRYYSDQKS